MALFDVSNHLACVRQSQGAYWPAGPSRHFRLRRDWKYGIPVPENSVLWVAGCLVWKGRLRLPLVLLVGIAAVVVGGESRLLDWPAVRPANRPPTSIANVLGASCYVPSMVGEGYAVAYGFGRSVKRIQRGASRLEDLPILGAILAGLLFLGYRTLQRRRKRRGA